MLVHVHHVSIIQVEQHVIIHMSRAFMLKPAKQNLRNNNSCYKIVTGIIIIKQYVYFLVFQVSKNSFTLDKS